MQQLSSHWMEPSTRLNGVTTQKTVLMSKKLQIVSASLHVNKYLIPFSPCTNHTKCVYLPASIVNLRTYIVTIFSGIFSQTVKWPINHCKGIKFQNMNTEVAVLRREKKVSGFQASTTKQMRTALFWVIIAAQ